MSDISLEQRGSLGSSNTQIVQQNNYYGMTPEAASQIAINLFIDNFPKLQELARETALQVLYQLDMTGEEKNFQQVIENWAAEFSVSEKSLEFVHSLVAGTIEHKKEIDEKIASTAHEWTLERMNAVDRNLMRLAVYEMFYNKGTPHRAILNEAIEIAKKFGGEDSTKFINGILDKLMDAGEKVAKLYGVSGFPTSYIIDENGVIKRVHRGYMDENQLKSALEDVVK
jgi:N utilization substance protein B